ncbi:MAG TPA: D-2-hydroxyacid dehydrogenase family protein [Mycobacteriales bacterium]|nr:D-2-hydroxyacid dehydrogenase family protein [Mycobacteriales bacterium]
MRVTLLDDYQDVALAGGPWEQLDAEVVAVRAHLTGDDLVAALAGSEVVVAMRERTPFDRALLDRLPDLRLLVTTGMANASIDLDACRERGVLVCGTRSRQEAPAELTWALVLAVTRRLAFEDAAVRAGGWQTTIGPELSGRTLGVLGLGRLGSRVAGYGRAFGMKVLGWSANLDPAHARELGVDSVALDDLLTRADVVTIHLKLSDRTTGLIGARELGLIGPQGYLVNTSRGPIVDEAALVEALHTGTIAGAGLDVFDVEPLPAGHPLRSAPRTVLSPHLGYVSTDTYRTFFADAVEDVAAWVGGSPVRVLS